MKNGRIKKPASLFCCYPGQSMRRLLVSMLLALVGTVVSATSVLGSDQQTQTIITLIPTAVVSNAGAGLLRVESDFQGKPKNTTLLRFETQSLPQEAQVTQATLRLVWKSYNKQSRQTISVIAIQDNGWKQDALNELLKNRFESEKKLEVKKNLFGLQIQ